MIKLRPLLEKTTGTYDKGCVMVELQFPHNSLEEIQQRIDPNWLYEEQDDDSYGLEDQPHITLLYGLDPRLDPAQITEALGEWKPRSNYNIHHPSIFQSEKYDVLKYDVRAADLNQANELLCKLPHQNDYPNYHPHVTIGYVQPGMGQRCVQAIGRGTISLPVKTVVYKANGKTTKIG